MLRQAGNLPAMPPQTIVALDARNEPSVMRTPLARPIAGRLDPTPGWHPRRISPLINLGLISLPVDRSRYRDREVRLLAIVQGLIAAAETGLKEYERRRRDLSFPSPGYRRPFRI